MQLLPLKMAHSRPVGRAGATKKLLLSGPLPKSNQRCGPEVLAELRAHSSTVIGGPMLMAGSCTYVVLPSKVRNPPPDSGPPEARAAVPYSVAGAGEPAPRSVNELPLR